MEKFKNKIKDIIKELPGVDKDFGIEIYTDYRDRELSVDTIRDIFNSDCPQERFNEILDEWVADNYPYQMDFLISAIKEYLSDEEKEFFDDNEDEITDYIRETVYFYYNSDDFNNELLVNIMVDCGNGNYDYACDNILNYCGSEEIQDESSVLWLSKTQDKEADLRELCQKAFNGEFESSESPQGFVETSVQELENFPGNMGTVTFLVRMKLKDIFKILEIQKEEFDPNAQYDPRLNKSESYLLLGKETQCGIFDPWTGAGSCMEIQLEKDVKLPIKYAELCVDGCKMHGYDVQEVYCMMESCWKESLKCIKKIA